MNQDLARESKFQWLARFGFVMRGLLYIVIALLVIGTGRTSIRVKVEAWKRPRNSAQAGSAQVTEGVFTYVAIGDDKKPRLLPGTPG